LTDGDAKTIVRRLLHKRKVTRTLKMTGFGVFLVLITLLAVFYTRAGMHTRVYAAPANTLNFQARLQTSAGNVVPDGAYSIEFRLYETASGGTAVWTETQANVQARNGYLSVYLGSVSPFPSNIDWSEQHWLTMNVNSDGEMNPRIRLTAVPYAFRAAQANALRNGTGTLSADDILQKAPLTIQSVNGAVAGLRFNQTGSGGLIQLQGDGSDVFTVNKAGNGLFGGTLQVNGASLSVGTASTKGSLVLQDGLGNSLTLQPGTQAGNLVFTLPSTYGGSGNCLVSDGSGGLSFAACGGSGGNAFEQGGNSFGALGVIGTNDNNALAIRTNGVERLRIDTGGNIGIGLTLPVERLDVDGAIRIGNTTNTNAGTIRWTGTDFEGYNGADWVSLTNGGSSGPATLALSMFFAYEATGNIDISAGWTDMTLGAQVRADSQFTHTAGTAPITINEDGWYEITYNISTYTIAGGNNQASTQAKLQENTGLGYSDIPGSLGYMFLRSGGSDSNASVTVLREFAAGDIIRMQAQRSSGAIATLTSPNSVGVTIRKVVEGGSSGGGSAFSQGGNEFGATAVLGTNDLFGMNFITNSQTRMSISGSGAVTVNNGLTVSSGGLSVTGDSAINGALSGITGLTLASGGIAMGGGSISGVGPNISSVNGLTISSGGGGNLSLESSSGLIILNANTLRRTASGTTTIDLFDGADTTLAITNSGAGSANLNVEGLVTANSFSGSGAGLTGLSAGNITSGTLSDSVLSSNVALRNTAQTFSGLQTFGGALVVGNTSNSTTGAIRWTGADFEGYNGSEWVSLTSGGGTSSGSYASARLTTAFASNINTAGGTVIDWDSQKSVNTPPFTHSTVTNPSRVTITEDGTYRIYVNLNFTSTVQRAAPKVQVRLNGTTLFDGTGASGYIRSLSGHNNASVNLTIVEDLQNGDYLEVISTQDAETGTVTLIPNQSLFIVETASASSSGGGSSGSGLEFVQNGNAFGTTALLGTTDNEGLTLITGGNAALSIDALGEATFENGLTVNNNLLVGGAVAFEGGLLTLGTSTQAGELRIQDGSANTGSFQTAALSANRVYVLPDEDGTICLSSGNCGAAGDFAELGGNTVTGSMVLGTNNANALLFKTDNTNRLSIDTSGNINVISGALQTNNITRLTNGGALQNITGLAIISGGATIIGNSTITGTLGLSSTLTISAGGMSVSGGINNNSGGITNTGSIAGATTVTASGDINSTGGGIQTSSITRLTNSGALQNISSITASGNINTTAGVYQVNGISGVSGSCSGGNNAYLRDITVAGGIITAAICRLSGASLSDERLKENVVELDSSILDNIGLVNTVNFNFKCDINDSDGFDIDCSEMQTGVIAQELAGIFPELVYQGEDGFYRVKYDALNIYTLKAVSELAKTINSIGDVKANTISTAETVRISEDGKLQNINGLSLLSGGASIIGGIDNNYGGLSNVGAILGATTIQAQSVELTGTAGSAALKLTKDDTDVFTLFSNGALELRVTDKRAFLVRDDDGMDLFRVNTEGGLVQIGSQHSSPSAILFILSRKNTPGDPVGVNGAQYYNEYLQRFRCYQDDKWVDCVAASVNEYIIAGSQTTWVSSVEPTELPDKPRTWIDLGSVREFRTIVSVEQAVSGSASCRLQFQLDGQSTWSDLGNEADVSVTELATVRGEWISLNELAREGEAQVRVVCEGGNGRAVINAVRLQVR
jgi:hypothetical protein